MWFVLKKNYQQKRNRQEHSRGHAGLCVRFFSFRFFLFKYKLIKTD
jgi:hypothetical protein